MDRGTELAAVAVLGSGVTAGVLLSVAVSVVPTLGALEAGEYVRVHQLLGAGYHPLMPVLVTATLAAEIGCAAVAPAAAPLFAAAAAVTVVVQVVSHYGNVPLNRSVHDVDPRRLPRDWYDPRASWARRHRVRTVAALLAAALTVAGVLAQPAVTG